MINMDLHLADDAASNHIVNTQDTLSWLDGLADLQASSGASVASGSGLSSESPGPRSLHAGASSSSSNPAASSISSSLSPVSREDGYTTASSSSSADGPRKAKKSKIALDSNQPLTAKGKPRARVYVACHEWYRGVSSLWECKTHYSL